MILQTRSALATALMIVAFQTGTAVGQTLQVVYTVSRHPALSSPVNLPALFNQGADLLRSDDDGVGSGSEDDVTFSVNFTITEDEDETFPNQSSSSFPAAQRYDYTLPRYNDIPNDVVGDQLREATFAKLKQVNTGHDFTAWAMPSNKSIIFTQATLRSTTVHEWGHNCGLPHRDSSSMNIMYSNANANKNEINVTERIAMQNYNN